MHTRLVAALATALVLFAVAPCLPARADAAPDGLEAESDFTAQIDKLAPKQGATGIRGAVASLAGEPIPGASIDYIGPGMRAERTVTAGPDGVFVIERLVPGPWVLTVTAKGYRTRHDLATTVTAGAMSQADVRMRRTPAFGSQLVRFGAAHAWAAATLSTGLLLWVYRRRRECPVESLPKSGVAIAVGVAGGTALGWGLAVLADTFVHHIGVEPLTTMPPRLDLWWARNTAMLLVSHVAGFTGAILGVAAGLTARQGASVAQSALAPAIGAAAAGAALTLSKAPSSASMLVRMLAMLDESASAQTWVMYFAIGIVGSALVGAIIGLCVSFAVVGLTRLSLTGVAAS